MTLSEEKLIAYADGEVSGEERIAVEAELKARPDLAAFVERQRALRRAFDSGLASVMDEVVPDRLLKAVATTPASSRWRWRRTLESLAGRRFLLWSAMPAGAALALGLVVGIILTPQGSFRVDNGRLLARGALSTALGTHLASEQQPQDVRVGISFLARDGRYCRTFTASPFAGIACHDAKGWAVAALASAPTENGAYHMASAMPSAVRDAIETMIDGAPLDAAQEKRARDEGWRAR